MTTTTTETPETEPLENKVEAIREDLGDLVGELDRRRHRATKPLFVGAVAVVGLSLGAFVLSRRLRRSQPSRLQLAVQALRRATDHPERVAKESPSVGKKVLAAAVTAVTAVVVRRAAERVMASREQGGR